MNTILISKYLQYLRKTQHLTQDDLANELGISRQAVSKWETGTALPDLDSLLRLSRRYNMTINDLLEPKISPQKITDFEQLSTLSEKELQEAVRQFDHSSIVIALMGASPETNCLFEKMFPEIDYETLRNQIGRIQIERVEEMQTQILCMINLQAVGRT
ncbi:MAG: helix-turn-helix domain-containing protein [Lachnospiraceae bacterium]|nr:helix-turn-helix domain-containing protein [Lachnospiraceae bacterium]MDE7183475.1 helix-turn-helix domain-containing protein [Lachnospiraceae bacterium]